ncbi:hypothetical protein BC628DRAFT_1048382 [Trametes gibbosa]|nr:hypothetical protein BC628DRAFT_1048382 [Trametes gibbosa]
MTSRRGRAGGHVATASREQVRGGDANTAWLMDHRGVVERDGLSPTNLPACRPSPSPLCSGGALGHRDQAPTSSSASAGRVVRWPAATGRGSSAQRESASFFARSCSRAPGSYRSQRESCAFLPDTQSRLLLRCGTRDASHAVRLLRDASPARICICRRCAPAPRCSSTTPDPARHSLRRTCVLGTPPRAWL